ncbi:MAG: hypothetical protein SGJ23_04745 [Alphaproteobacteria bacterium]|nr:hypothetical protein [Alphaproteobacteria bacterium]
MGGVTGWTGSLLALGGAFLTLAGIFGVGFKVGQRERARTLENEIDQLKELLRAARNGQETDRQEASKWRSRYNEIAPQATVQGKSAQNKLEDVRKLIDDPKSTR